MIFQRAGGYATAGAARDGALSLAALRRSPPGGPLQRLNSYLLAQHIADAQLIIYPDSGHGFLYPSRFVARVARFRGIDAAFA